jgi:hypothetical protein
MQPIHSWRKAAKSASGYPTDKTDFSGSPARM